MDLIAWLREWGWLIALLVPSTIGLAGLTIAFTTFQLQKIKTEFEMSKSNERDMRDRLRAALADRRRLRQELGRLQPAAPLVIDGEDDDAES